MNFDQVENQIDPSVRIIGKVELGKGNVILPNCVLIGPLRIGDRNWLGPNVVIGTPGQNTRAPHHDSSDQPIEIGSDNIIREFTAIQKPCFEQVTKIGSNCFLMQSVHVPHDAQIENGCVLTPMVAMGGLVRLMECANLALGVTLHQRVVVGAYSIAGMGAVVVKNIKPFSRFIPGKPISVNDYAIEKFGFESNREEIGAYVLNDELPKSDNLRKIVDRFMALHERSEMGIYR